MKIGIALIFYFALLVGLVHSVSDESQQLLVTAYVKSLNPFRVSMKSNIFDKQGGIAVGAYKYDTNTSKQFFEFFFF